VIPLSVSRLRATILARSHDFAMKHGPSDTAPQAERVLMRLMRDAPALRKLELVAEMNAAVRLLALSGLRHRYPQAIAEELDRRLADILLGPELAARAYGPLEKESAA
jgi:hypothetical protein